MLSSFSNTTLMNENLDCHVVMVGWYLNKMIFLMQYSENSSVNSEVNQCHQPGIQQLLYYKNISQCSTFLISNGLNFGSLSPFIFRLIRNMEF